MTTDIGLDWNEIRTRAAQFAARWSDEEREQAGAQGFWTEFLNVFGLDARQIAEFERRVTGLQTGSGRGRIDMLIPGQLLAEHKSRGRDLQAALQQALDYVDVLEEHERPRWVVVSDYERLHLYDRDTSTSDEFPLIRLPQRVERFGFLIARELRRREDAAPVNVQAARKMAALHDELRAAGYTGHDLELLLVRLLFVLFGDRAGLWDQNGLFRDLLEDETRTDGENLGFMLMRLFETLNTPRDRRQAQLPAKFKVFPHVNGALFAETLRPAEFSPEMRRLLLDACRLDWSQVSPAIFGSMFQGVMDPQQRAHLGAHYTSETNILRAIGPLFLDELKAQRESARGDRRRLQQFLDALPTLRFLDPACGSGNFLLVAFRELRRLELDALAEMMNGRQVLDIDQLLRVNVEQFYGIELDEFAAQIARVALWLADHQMNREASQRLGQSFVRLPLSHGAHIRHADALETDWVEHLELEQHLAGLRGVYVLGNPPFIGGKKMSAPQRAQVVRDFPGVKDSGVLDYVAAWYIRSARLLRETMRLSAEMRAQVDVRAALVSTNSVTQGEQVAPLWTGILGELGLTITAAHRTFKWSNDAPGQAAVHVVIIQMEPASQAARRPRRLFTYSRPAADPVEVHAQQIGPYLADAPPVIVRKAQAPLRTGVPPIHFGNMPLDGGNLLLTREERDELLAAEENAAPYVRPLLDAKTFLNGGERFCLWLEGVSPAVLATLPHVCARVDSTRQWRLDSVDAGTRRMAQSPALFRDRRLPERYLVVPGFSSERREYVPVAYLDSSTVVNNKLYMIPDADLVHFGLIQSRVHMDWMRLVGGRLKSDYSYTKDVVYNTFPWPDRAALRPRQVQVIEEAAQAVLDARAAHPDSSLAQLYDPLLMPADLRAAHNALDRAVEAALGIRAGNTEAQRVAHLLAAYQALAPTLETQAKKPKRKPQKTQ
ncbi:methylase [Deinococcus seoulensis]|uniref:site-specific DNA-methyltransferase (adenine-specific) n=1 Tax=Deinococcus seoulensis TaxID=1837379 RepID=A0ABQ2S0J1_9DEIO|nr:class I SAM-dependent DNA methyltransferase [Deinococcus seoulensis]GGR75763.1 methylase [Deinococcus seoulensis]